jgi:hypothetical protein
MQARSYNAESVCVAGTQARSRALGLAIAASLGQPCDADSRFGAACRRAGPPFGDLGFESVLCLKPRLVADSREILLHLSLHGQLDLAFALFALTLLTQHLGLSLPGFCELRVVNSEHLLQIRKLPVALQRDRLVGIPLDIHRARKVVAEVPLGIPHLRHVPHRGTSARKSLSRGDSKATARRPYPLRRINRADDDEAFRRSDAFAASASAPRSRREPRRSGSPRPSSRRYRRR